TRHRPTPPELFSGIGIIGADKSADAELGAAVSDDHFILYDARRAGDGVVILFAGHLNRPDLLARFSVQCDNPAVQRAGVDLSPVIGHSPVDGPTAQAWSPSIPNSFLVRHERNVRNFRIPAPLWFSGSSVNCEDHAPG